ncbi:MAG: bifunctional phosphopantothenoylcysteine decarboxylase/phosphopantothenate--cysteine ligase CoaBC [Proteobacteria bacterium]|nr:bifunctional phosphopantothenoylcysteine decarboxylase/phosphopantothenate--cysteine ligase CoaBC [Pseudomonadota bacterium]
MARKIPKHPSLDIVGSDGLELSGKKIVLCVAGSVAAYKSIELARLLMRHGANVTCVASGAATKLIQPAYFKWATGNPVITKLTGNLEHIAVADYKKSDLIIVYPCTANTLGKLASGIDDTPIATVLTVGFGSGIPIVMCLAMHASMYDNISVKKNISFLKKKIDFVSPNMIEGKAKAAEPEDVLGFVLKKFGFSSVLRGKKVLITAGPTIEYIDPLRVITNQSTGRTGVMLASELVSAGAKVTMVYGPGREKAPSGVKLVSVKTAKEMLNAVKAEMKKRFDIVIMAAAPADYTLENPKKSKIKSNNAKMSLKLTRVPKIIDQVKKLQKDVFLVGFKALAKVSRKELEAESRRKMKDCKADLMVANDVGAARYRKNPENNEVLFVDSKKSQSSGWKPKEKIAKLIKKEIERRIN